MMYLSIRINGYNMSPSVQIPILDHMATLADLLRGRVLLVLTQQELTVSELCTVLQLPQSTVSRHLKILGDDGWVSSRPEGTRRLYSFSPDDLDPAAQQLWPLAGAQISASPRARQDRKRLLSVLKTRRSRTREFFDTAAGAWDRKREELFGHTFYLFALLGLLDRDWVVADLGCGTGPVAEALAPCVAQVIAVDESDSMLDAARLRLQESVNVDMRQGALEALPIEDGQVDAATLILVMHHLSAPSAAIEEVHRVLKPGGKLILVDMLPHDHQEYRQEMGHIHLGFSGQQIKEFLGQAGLEQIRLRPLGPEADAKGPALFSATAVRPLN
jgi:ubiquinone/menaquinone biosynthesis C-methylase UbiE/DNA-binding transcriptional ArsR family regulator